MIKNEVNVLGNRLLGCFDLPFYTLHYRFINSHTLCCHVANIPHITTYYHNCKLFCMPEILPKDGCPPKGQFIILPEEPYHKIKGAPWRLHCGAIRPETIFPGEQVKEIPRVRNEKRIRMRWGKAAGHGDT